MSLVTKIILIFMSLLAMHTILNYGMRKFVQEPAYNDTESRMIRRDMGWFAGSLDRESDKMRLTCRNIVGDGELLSLACDASKQADLSSYAEKLMRLFSLNIIIILDKDNNLVFSSLVGDDYLTPVNIEGFTAPKWSQGHPLLEFDSETAIKSGLLKVRESLAYVASSKIPHDNTLNGGALIVGRLITDQYLKSYTSVQEIETSIVSANEAGFREGDKIVNGFFYLTKNDEGKYSAILAINDVSGRPVLAIKALLPPGMADKIRKSNRATLLAELCFMFITLMLMVFLVYRIMGSRLEKLIDHIIGIRHSGVLVKIVQESSGDEIDLLGYEFNQMVTRIQRDIELRTQVEIELKRSLAELERFADVASHDLQEPLRSVASCLQLLEMQYTDKIDEQGKQLIGYAVQGARRMKTLIKALLAYSNIGNTELNITTCNTNQVIAEAIDELKKEIDESGAKIICDDLPVIAADGFRLLLLFTNLIDNALKYTVPGRVPVINIKCEKVEKTWRFSVTDNGVGIEKEYYTQIFVAFKRLYTQEEHEGSGIGLAICKRIVEQHKGRIWVKSEPGKGSTFYFSIPA